MDCTPQSLATAAKCFKCIPKSAMPLVRIELLCVWSNSGCVVPDAPVALDATNINPDATKFTANWNASALASGYILIVSPNPTLDGEGTTQQDVGNVTGLNFVDGFSPNTYYGIIAYNDCGQSVVSNVIVVNFG